MKDLSHFCIGLLTLSFIACISNNPTGLSTHLETTTQQQQLTSLISLNQASSDNYWGQFFQERGANKIWQELQKREAQLRIDFSMLEGLPDSDTVDQVVAGIILYLSCHNPTIQQLFILGTENEKLRELPPEIGELTNLTKLYLPLNQLTEVPAALGKLTRLTWLNLNNNKLAALPSSLEQNPYSYMEQNPWWKTADLEKLSPEQLHLTISEGCQLFLNKCVIYFKHVFNASGESFLLPFYWDQELGTTQGLQKMLEKLKDEELYLAPCKIVNLSSPIQSQ